MKRSALDKLAEETLMPPKRRCVICDTPEMSSAADHLIDLAIRTSRFIPQKRAADFIGKASGASGVHQQTWAKHVAHHPRASEIPSR